MARGGSRGLSESLITTGIHVTLILSLAVVVVSLFGGIGQQINNSLPTPTQGSIFYNITSTVNKGVNSVLGMITPLFVVGISTLVMIALWWVFNIIRG